MTNSSGHPGLDPAIVDKLLDLLSSNDGFRESFHKNPAAALAELGYQAPLTSEKAAARSTGEEAAPAFACMITRQIASKEEILAARAELQRHLTAGGNHNNPHAFEAGRVGDFLKNNPDGSSSS
ncbi:NHLP-related RiPP peptide [Pseudomonas sp. CGJS7]|uniref:NHLP-related RiPP peptide n=1 Tax=Pseudomonas sp. CGJS7 TaxID=3109348 RepID=UPI00300BDE72